MPSVLFVCTANQFRSPIAAALFSRQMQGQPDGMWKISSAGTWAMKNQPIADFAVRIAHSLGLEGLAGHHSRSVNADLLNQTDLCIVMESGQKEALGVEFPQVRGRVFMLSEIIDQIPYDIPDPAQPGNDPDEVARELQSLIQRGAARISALADSLHRP